MLYNCLCMCLLVCCIMACSTDNTDDASIFPVPPTIPEETKETTPPVVPAQVVPPPVPEPIVEEPVIEEPIVEEPEPEPIEEEREPEDNRAPLFIRTTVNHGDIDVDIDTDRFIFTFDENIGDARVKLRNDTRNFDMEWEKFIVGKEITLLKFLEGWPLQGAEVYTIEISWADKAGNWDPGGIITFVTRAKE
ncbi:MAG: hypothetical protein OXG97_04900 [Candidatus Poribacteria bacterium]|nr:hypothetical protein [Candidatus Poribacteria bacterium]